MKIDIITLFPDMFAGPFATSMLKKAQDNGLVAINLVDLRQFGLGARKQVDDTPYGGGDGMVLKVDVVVPAIEFAKGKQQTADGSGKSARSPISGSCSTCVVLLTPQGVTYTQAKARELSGINHLILVAGHYEGWDERIRKYVDLELSIGDYVLTGGEIPAMAVVDSVVRLIPGVLGGENSAADESFSDGESLEYPHYTRPVEFRGDVVPQILQNGHHAEIAKWRAQQSAQRTKKRA